MMGTSDKDSAHVQSFQTIVTGNKTDKRDASAEAKLAFLHRDQSALSTIVMTISDSCLSATVNTEYAADLCSETKYKYDLPAEETVYALITPYHLTWMRGDEHISCYADQVTSMEKQLSIVGQSVKQ